MKKSAEDKMPDGAHAVEELLGRAVPRPVPPAQIARHVRRSVHAEWRAMRRQRVMRRRVMASAAAALVLLVVAVTFKTLGTGNVQMPRVATVSKSFGSVYFFGAESELLDMSDRFELSAGQMIVTGNSSGIGLAWEQGGSLRIDEDSRVEFVSANRIRLQSGRVYFDSDPSALIAGFSASSVAGGAPG